MFKTCTKHVNQRKIGCQILGYLKKPRTTDTQWMHKLKISEKLGLLIYCDIFTIGDADYLA